MAFDEGMFSYIISADDYPGEFAYKEVPYNNEAHTTEQREELWAGLEEYLPKMQEYNASLPVVEEEEEEEEEEANDSEARNDVETAASILTSFKAAPSSKVSCHFLFHILSVSHLRSEL